MALSENEQKMLDELEKQLFADDPKLARTFSSSSASSGGSEAAQKTTLNPRRIVLGCVGVLAGLALLVFAVSLPAVWLGVLAFLLMLGSAVFAITGDRARPATATVTDADRRKGRDAHPAGKGGSPQGLMKKFEDRWDKRQSGDR
ncbi:DUF3040 domain-containing protein [Helcobacillus sp. ACRRO]|uniref:DUF3040 domain-containing protein n=1 Tax=Helcobacillus sp. ACRRO TaxID=2918202 RepID=UPI001EF5AB15|nr:DUF3040 domain-containing protein [Helcobacillus sp. ACRRO]MCG7427138.1 DUF3040 domain-containing protein [Helcobacillus sp. ACRRO]